ncbi:hypothetical protein ACJ41O_014907 [Fusarium nematophilum]
MAQPGIADKAQPFYRLTHEIPHLDIGTGHPSDILREAEFVHSLILLYFGNFSDVHFMFEEELFLRQFAVGEVPKVVLYSMMALSIRYSHAPFEDPVSASHRGEILYGQARDLLKQEFDEPSTANVQAYVLLSTYKLTFGGSRQANVYLGFAVNLVRALRLEDEKSEVDPLRLEMSRRLMATITLMDMVLSPALGFRFQLNLPQDEGPTIRSDEDLSALKHRVHAENHVPRPSTAQEILSLSKILAAVCQSYRGEDSTDVLRQQEEAYLRITASRDPSLAWNEENLERNQQRDSLRRFAFMHVLSHHVGQLVYFKALGCMDGSRFSDEDLAAKVSECHRHARAIVDIVDYTSTVAGFDLHNFCMGQVLTVATVVHTHALLVAPSEEAVADVRRRIEGIRAHVNRVKGHCRMFIWVSNQIEQFLRLCDRSGQPLNELLGRDPALLGQMLKLGSYYENRSDRTGGSAQGLESLLQTIPGWHHSPLSGQEAAAHPHRGSAVYGSGTVDLGAQDWSLDDLAWAFWDSSLPQLYALPNT